ncbi:hypothetical protein TNCV_2469281 [Trichonephila clavipes]|nr:hypothetical protein TNCV_2469281 [Trichonephila clavipes]
MESLGFFSTRFSMAFRFLEVFTVRFRPLPGRRPSLPSSLKRQIASDTVCRVARQPRVLPWPSQEAFSRPSFLLLVFSNS